MKFRLERSRAGANPVLAAALPLIVEVREEPRVSYPAPCSCRVMYRLTDKSTEELKRGGMIRREAFDVNPCVCSCLGSIVPEDPPYRTVRQMRNDA